MTARARTAVLFAVLGALRFAHLGAPLTTDEGFTIKRYATAKVDAITTTYDAPNNHILLSLTLHAIDAVSPKKLFGTLASPWPLQLPSILGSVASLFLLYAIAAILLNRRAAVLATTALGVSFWALAYSHMLRGYSLSLFLNLLCVWVVLQGIIRRRLLWLLALPFALAAAHYMLPTNAACTAGLILGTLVLMRGRWSRRAAVSAAAALAAGALLTLWLYRPVLGAMADYAHALAGSAGATDAPPLAVDVLRVLGADWLYRLPFAAVALGGLAFGLSRRGKRRSAAAFTALALAVPPLLFSFGAPPPARVFTALLPWWALAFAMGLEGGAAVFKKRFGLKPAVDERAATVLILATLVLSTGQVVRFWNWNRGLDARGAFAALVPLVAHSDDFVVIPTQMGDTSVIEDKIDWESYGFGSSIFPYYDMGLDSDFRYLIRGTYFVLAADEPSARAALARSGADAILSGSLKLVATRGKVRIYRADLDAEVLARARALSRNSAALADLAADALRREKPVEAAAFLEKAKALAPDDEKIRFLLGESYYLAFDDAKAEPELGWVVARDSNNVHAPILYGDALAARARFDEAAKAYAYYSGPSAGPGAYMFADRAKAGAEAARRRMTARLDWTSFESLIASGRGFYAMGSLERARAAYHEAFRRDKTLKFRSDEVQLDFLLKRYAAAEDLLRECVAKGGGEVYQLALAQVLGVKRRVPEARAALAEVLQDDPRSVKALELRATLNRF